MPIFWEKPDALVEDVLLAYFEYCIEYHNLMEYTEEREVERGYIQPQKLERVMIKCEELLQKAA